MCKTYASQFKIQGYPHYLKRHENAINPITKFSNF